MGRRRFTPAIQVAIVVIVSLAAGDVARAGVAVGASFGYTHLSYPEVPVANFTNDVVGVPGAAAWGQPGLRIAYIAPSSRWDLIADVGLLHRTGTIGNDETSMELMTQVQGNATARKGLTPFVNGGLGIMYESASVSSTRSISVTRPAFGAGFGVRQSVSDGHGLLRIELRYDRVSKSEKRLDPSSTFTFPTISMFTVKLGFDLLVAR